MKLPCSPLRNQWLSWQIKTSLTPHDSIRSSIVIPLKRQQWSQQRYQTNVKRRVFMKPRRRVRNEKPEHLRHPVGDDGERLERPPKHDKRGWSPYSEQGQGDLDSLVNALSSLSPRTQADVADTSNTPTYDAATPADSQPTLPTDDANATLPSSPMELHYKRITTKTTKPRPPKHFVSELASNPWAQMLAAPLRQCGESKVRLPNTLLLDFSMVKNPSDDSVYMLPAQLADLEAFKSKLDKEEDDTAKMLRRPVASGARQGVRLVPSKVMLEEATTRLVRKFGPKREIVTKPGEVAGAYLQKLVVNLRKVADYKKANKGYEDYVKQHGGQTSGEVQDPNTVSNLKDLKWKADAADRVANILKQRVLIVLDKILSDAQDTVLTATIPEQPHLFVSEGQLDTDRSTMSADFWNDMGDIEAPGAITGNASAQGNSNDSRPPVAILPGELPETNSDATSSWLPGSIFLHAGAVEDYVTMVERHHELSSTTMSEAGLPPMTKHSLIPPVITVEGRYRLPVYNLESLLGPEFFDVLSALSSKYAEHLQTEGKERLMLFKASSTLTAVLASELWQLWRYIGGRQGLFLGKDYVPPEQDFGGLVVRAPFSEVQKGHLYNLLKLEKPKMAEEEQSGI